MDLFEDAAGRLARDQSKMRDRRQRDRGTQAGGSRRNGNGIALSARARTQAEFAKKEQARLKAERERRKRNERYRNQRRNEGRRMWNETSLGSAVSVSGDSTTTASSLFLAPTSIHGDGDKIALPSSVLETLAAQNNVSQQQQQQMGGNPWIFRIGIVNPDYVFPASPLFRALEAPAADEDDDEDTSDDDDMSDDDDDGDDEEQQQSERYLDELGHKYIAYTHCTVVEFTQDEGHVGIPSPIAKALLDATNRHESHRRFVIPTTITKDPAAAASSEEESAPDANLVVTSHTPGHLAWGAFAIPDSKLEITMVRLPKGRGCTLTPTPDALRNGFHGLPNVKLVLEQSLIRTRATLSRGDVVSTWFRGTRFDLIVAMVLPSGFRAVTCINTDIEVDIGEVEATTNNEKNTDETKPSESTTTTTTSSSSSSSSNSSSSTTGFRLGGNGPSASQSDAVPFHAQQPRLQQPVMSSLLLPEPPLDQTEGICTVRIQHSGGRGRRRFSVRTALVQDLFAFAASLTSSSSSRPAATETTTISLMTRFPRKEYRLSDHGNNSSNNNNNKDPSTDNNQNNHNIELYKDWTLAEAGFTAGQEAFILKGL